MPLDPTNWKTPANIIANVLATAIPAYVNIGTNAFVGFLPDAPANCIAIYDSGGGEQDSNVKLDTHSIQILGRNADYQTGYNLLNLIKANLQSIDPTTLDGESIVGIWVASNIAFLKRDDSGNSLFSSKYRVTIETQKDINR